MRQKITIALFALITTLPLLVNVLQWRDKKELPAFERRLGKQAATTPARLLGEYRDVVVFIAKINEYYDDQLSLRSKMLPAYMAIKENVFNTNAFPEKVIKGSEGWLFLGSTWSNIVAEAKGISQFTQEDINDIVEINEKRQRKLAEMGIVYITAIAPEKLSVYGQYISIEKSNRPTKREQLKEAFSSRSIPLVDMSKFFNEHRDEQLYFKTDTHWNDDGAYLGYLAVMEEIKNKWPDIEVFQLEQTKKETRLIGATDLNLMLKRNDPEETRSISVTDPQSSRSTAKRLPRPENAYTDRTDYEERFTNPTKKLKILFFRDSFASATMKYFAETFGEAVFVFSQYNQTVVDTETPDIVVLETVERDIDQWKE